MKKILILISGLSLGLLVFTLIHFMPEIKALDKNINENSFKKDLSTSNSDFDPSKIDINTIFKPNVVVEANESSINSTKQKFTVNETNKVDLSTSSDSSVTISSIGIIDEPILKGSLTDTKTLYSKLLYHPIIESVVTPDICSDYGNAYIYGHSEPPSKAESNYPASKIFSDLDKVKTGDLIQAKGQNGKKCTYKVLKMDTLTTNQDQKVDSTAFNFAYFPEFTQPTLTIQTCKKGSNNIRLLLRAELVSF